MLNSTAYSQNKNKENLVKGAKAPFAGVLLSQKALAKIITDYEKKISILNLKVEKLTKDNHAEKLVADKVCEARLSGEIAKLDAHKTSWEKQRTLYESTIKNYSSTPWYKTTYTASVLGCLACGGICAAAASR